MRKLQKYDIDKLEEYWLNYRKLAALPEPTTQTDVIRQNRIDDMLEAIETIYNDSRDTVRHVIDVAYLNTNLSVVDSKLIADSVGCSVRRVNAIRESLMEETAAIVGWV